MILMDARRTSMDMHYCEDSGLVGGHCFLDFLICLVLAQRIYRPNRCRNPANNGELEQQAKDARKWAANGEELQPRENKSKDQAHSKTSNKMKYNLIKNAIRLTCRIKIWIAYGNSSDALAHKAMLVLAWNLVVP